MSFLSLFAIFAYSQVFLRSLVTSIVKIYNWENVRPGKCRREECPIKEFSVGEVSGRAIMHRGTLLRGSVSLGSVHEECQSRNCPDTNLSVKPSQRNCYKEL